MTRTGRQIVKMFIPPFILTSFIIYAIYFEHLKEISLMIRNMAPSLILVVGAVLVYSNSSAQAKQLQRRGEHESLLTISNYDIYLLQFLMLFIPFIVAVIPLWTKNTIDFLDFIQGVITFFPLYWIRMRYFKYRYHRTDNNRFVLEDTITITYFDSMKLDAISFATTLAVVAIPGFITRTLQLSDLLQAGTIFLVIYWINMKYFKFV